MPGNGWRRETFLDVYRQSLKGLGKLVLPALVLALGMPDALADQAEEEGWIAHNQELLRQRLEDPADVVFRETFFSRKAAVPVACGEVKLPEAAGFQRFVGAGSVGVFLPGDVADFDALWGHFCRLWKPPSAAARPSRRPYRASSG